LLEIIVHKVQHSKTLNQVHITIYKLNFIIFYTMYKLLKKSTKVIITTHISLKPSKTVCRQTLLSWRIHWQTRSCRYVWSSFCTKKITI